MAQPHALALPPTFSPDELDVLTHLSTVLSEVRTTLQASTGVDKPTGNGAGDPSGTGGVGAANGEAASGLTFKDVARASDGIKHKLQRARTQVRGLPDMQRDIAAQEAEMKELEGRIERQRALLARLREEGLEFGKDDDGAAAEPANGDKMQET